jgi:polar amino acid transport system substrate-binding protein
MRVAEMAHTHDKGGGGSSKGIVTALAGITLVLVVLVSTVLSLREDGGDGGQRADRTAGARPAAAPAAAPERETCEDGSDPAASLKPSSNAGTAVKRIQADNQLVVGVDQNSFLWGYRDPNTGQITGFDIDLVQAIAEDLLGEQAKVVYKTIPTDHRIQAIQRRDVDMVVRTMTINCERLKDVAFSTAYFEAGQQLLVPSRSRIEGYDVSLKDQRVCTAQGSTGEDALKQKSHGAAVVPVDNQLDCLVRLQLGEVDAVITDSALAAGQAAQDPSVRLVGEPFTIEPYGVAMNLDDEDLVRRVNRVLEDYRSGGASSAWMASYRKWLAERLEDPSPRPPDPAYRD